MLDEETMENNATRFRERYLEYREYGCLLKVSEGQLSAVMTELDSLRRKFKKRRRKNMIIQKDGPT